MYNLINLFLKIYKQHLINYCLLKLNLFILIKYIENKTHTHTHL